MTIPSELVNELLLLILTGIAWLCYRLVVALNDISRSLGKLSGRMDTAEQWYAAHERLDEQQFQSVRDLIQSRQGEQA